jgi:hypothetical protein
MNKTLLDSFYDDTKKTRAYIEHINYTDELVRISVLDDFSEETKRILSSFQEHLKSFKVNKKVFEYKSIIISLYGILEKHIEVFVKEYLVYLSTLYKDYNDFSNTIRKNHFNFSLELIDSINRNFAKYQHLTKEQVIFNLNKCAEDSEDYILNVDCFFISSGNLNHKKIEEKFRNFEVSGLGTLLKNNLKFREYLSKEKNIDNLSNFDSDVFATEINDLVNRRNEIAHGEEVIDKLLTLSELLKYIDFLEVYCHSIFEILQENCIEKEANYKFQEIEMDMLKHGFSKEKNILTCQIDNYSIRLNEAIIIRTNNNHFGKEKIISLAKEKKYDYQELVIGKKEDIGIGITNNSNLSINKNCTFYLLKK